MPAAIRMSSTGWLAICCGNGSAGVFDTNDELSWQYLQPQSANGRSADENASCNLAKFSPNGRILVFSGPDQQYHVYVQTDFARADEWWQLQKTLVFDNSITALAVTDAFLLIADQIGDVYKVDLTQNDSSQRLLVDKDFLLTRFSTALLDLAFLPFNTHVPLVLIAAQGSDICLRSFPNTSQNENCCIGHGHLVSHLVLINNHHLLSAFSDGTIRLWHVPSCFPLALVHSKALTMVTKEIYYTELYRSGNLALMETYRNETQPLEALLDKSSPTDYSIWKMAAASIGSIDSDVYIAFSVDAHRSHSIYLTSLSNMKELSNGQRKLTLDASYGAIVDYCFPSAEIVFNDRVTVGQCLLYILFDSNVLIKVNVVSILFSCETQLFAHSDEWTQEVNSLLSGPAFRVIERTNGDQGRDDSLCEQLVESSVQTTNNAQCKRKIERVDEQEAKKRASSLSDENVSIA